MKQKSKTKIRLKDRTLENDIRYRGPLSYRYVRLIAWICIAIGQVAIVLNLASRLLLENDPTSSTLCTAWGNVLGIIGSLAISLFLVANFALILQSEEGIKSLVLLHLCCAVGIYVAFVLFYCRYLYGYANIIFSEKGTEYVDLLILRLFSSHLSFNVFIDLLMCSSTYFFLIYEPKKVFVGKKIAFFRLLTIFPVLYEVASCLISGLGNGLGYFNIPVIAIPLLPTKSIFTYLVFFIIILFVRSRKKWYLKQGKSESDYKNYLKTNANSLSFSIFIASIFLISGLLDFAATIGGAVLYMAVAVEQAGEVEEGMISLIAYSAFPFLQSWGISKNTDLILGAPIIMLFSYTKKHSPTTKVFDMLLPLVGIALCVFAYLEGGLALLKIFLGK